MNRRDFEKFASLDWKATGYLVSSVSVLFLGAISWPKSDDPPWYLPFLIIGMAASILGMGFRWIAHIHQKKQIAHKADRR